MLSISLKFLELSKLKSLALSVFYKKLNIRGDKNCKQLPLGI